jgi:dCTP deaminase
MRVSQLTFTELSSPAVRPYGPDRGSKYQGQSGPQASRIQGDTEFGGQGGRGGRQGRPDEVDRDGRGPANEAGDRIDGDDARADERDRADGDSGVDR